MKRRLGIGERINLFELLEKQTVYEFNKLFDECPLIGFSEESTVEIMEPLTADQRLIIINGEAIIHKMYRDILYGMDRQDFNGDESEKELDEMNGVML